MTDLLEPRYVTGKPLTADTLEGLIEQLPVEQAAGIETLRRYNDAVRDGAFDPSIKDGLGTEGLEPPKSNWALALDTPPYRAYPVTGGITFTFGGVRVDDATRVLDTAHETIPGLYACGEMVGGLFHHNYPGGAGLVSGAVFGRIAGASAAGNR